MEPNQPTPAASSNQPESSPSTPPPVDQPTAQSTPDVEVSRTPAEPPSTPAVTTSSVAPGSKKRWLLPIIVVVIVLLLAGGYVFGYYLPNTPTNVYNSSLENSGKAVDKLVAYTQAQDTAAQQGVTLDGTLKSTGGSTNFDATLNGAFDKNANGTLEAKADISGEHVTIDVRSVRAAGNKIPDIYVQLSGVQQLLAAYGLGDLDGKWVSIDHTLIDSYLTSIKQMTGGASGNIAAATATPTVEQINDVVNKVQTVNRQYLFTADSSKAVLTSQQFVGKEMRNNRPANHYKVSVNKEHLQAYVAALKTALDSSKLNDWSKAANGGKSLSESANWDELEKEVKSANPSTFDLWADNKTRLISAIQFTDSSNGSKVTIAQNYTGGDVYPFSLSISGAKNLTDNGTMGLSVDTKANKYTVTFDTATDNTGGRISFKLNVALSNQPVKVTAPSGATSLNDVLSGLFGGSGGFGSETGPGSNFNSGALRGSSTNNSSGSSFLTFTQ